MPSAGVTFTQSSQIWPIEPRVPVVTAPGATEMSAAVFKVGRLSLMRSTYPPCPLVPEVAAPPFERMLPEFFTCPPAYISTGHNQPDDPGPPESPEPPVVVMAPVFAMLRLDLRDT